MLGIDEEESKAPLHRQDGLQYPGRELDTQSASVLQQNVHSNMVAL